jgi:O-antigen ligase
MGMGLIKSYSRGAWFATLIGLLYLTWQLKTLMAHHDHENKKGVYEACRSLWIFIFPWIYLPSLYAKAIKQNFMPIVAILLALCVLMFCAFHDTDQPLLRRAFSVTNPNDFSWRNRVDAWEAALQMMADRPWLGFGWDAETCYEQYYCARRVLESGAIRMNDYLRLGTTVGVPALVCFMAYAGLAFAQKAGGREPKSTYENGMDSVTTAVALRSSHIMNFQKSACRAGAIVLLVGFWFDGGLFLLPTASTFCIFINLGRR